MDESIHFQQTINDIRGVHPPETMINFSPLFQISPYFRKIFGLSEIFLQFYLFRKISSLSSTKISDDLFFSHRPQISNFPPIFAVSVHFPPCFAKIILSPYFYKFPPCFRQIHLLFTYFTCISPPPTFTMMHLCITQCMYWTPLTSDASFLFGFIINPRADSFLDSVYSEETLFNYSQIQNSQILPPLIIIISTCHHRSSVVP